MGKKSEVLRVNPRTLGGRKVLSCFTEMMAFMSCLKYASFNSDNCGAEKRALNACMELQASPSCPFTTSPAASSLGSV
eukprot:SM000052S17750  [mRNA]  locus=s52:573441:573674:+ [translate_table: standard]